MLALNVTCAGASSRATHNERVGGEPDWALRGGGWQGVVLVMVAWHGGREEVGSGNGVGTLAWADASLA